MIQERTRPAGEMADRLIRYARYFELVAEQLEALREEDKERLRLLNDERLAMEAELAEEAAERGESAPSITDLDDYLRVGRAELEERLHAEQLAEEQWCRLSEEVLRSARLVPVARFGARYYPEPDWRTSSLDRRF